MIGSEARAVWKNPYIDKVGDCELIFSAKGALFSDENKKRISEKLNEFDKIVVELGCGSGGHLYQRAVQNPGTLFIGFELRYKRIFLSAKKALQAGLNNLIFIKTDARFFFDVFKDKKLHGIYINFPDPWEKRRTRKNRLINEEFLNRLAHILEPNGFFSFKTDHQQYFNEVLACLSFVKDLQKIKESSDLTNSEYALGNVRSEFEMLFISKGLPIYFVETKKVGAS